MKCILCPKCGDVRRLLDYPTVCTCGASWGQYKDANRAEYGGEAAPIFIDNNSLANAVHRWRAQDARTYGIRFTAGIAGKTSPTFKKVEQ